MTPTPRQMGKTLKKLPTRKKLGQAALAKRAGLSREYVNERGLAMSESLPVPTAEHITEVLRRVGALKDNGAVSDVTVEMSRATLISSIGRLRLTYTGQSVERPLTSSSRRAATTSTRAWTKVPAARPTSTPSSRAPRRLESSPAVTRRSPRPMGPGVSCSRISLPRMRP